MVLVDSSVWIEYFRGNDITLPLNKLIENNSICINDLVLAELVPSIIQKGEEKLVELLNTITKVDLVIVWNGIIAMQIKNLKSGINRVGINDLVIAQNVMEHGLELYTLDKHFFLMSEIHQIQLFS